MKNLLLIFGGACLIGCATTARYEAKLNTWLGQPEASLIQAWGVPSRSHQISEKSKAIVFERSGPETAIGTYNPYSQSVLMTAGRTYCNTTFFIEDGIVTKWRWDGNQCKSK